MKVVIRVDASLQMGTGHVMRCLTLAKALRKKEASVSFICREHLGHLIETIQNQGFMVYSLPKGTKSQSFEYGHLYHSAWLGETQLEDLNQCRPVLENLQPDWLIVDHYAIDQFWQKPLKGTYRKLMVIDDLADRHHQCDLLLDQNYSSTQKKYESYVPKECLILAGTEYVLLRSEFNQWREYSLERRTQPQFKKLLITMGGVDSDNVTGQVLHELAVCPLPRSLEITVVMGEAAPHLAIVKAKAFSMPYKVEVKVNVNDVAELMANADLAIGAAGATTWERCCLGLPTIQIVVAENQRKIAQSMMEVGAVKLLNRISELSILIGCFNEWAEIVSLNSSYICEGSGVGRVVQRVMEI